MNKIIITSAITLVLSLGACSEQKTAEQLIASANQYSQQGKLSNAIIDYKNAVRLAPKSAEARIGLGRAYLNQGNYISAEKELDKAVELGVSYAQAATLLAQVKTRLDKFEEVEQLVKLSEELNDNDYLTVLSYAGMATLANGQAEKAQDYFSQAAAILPESAYSKLSQAYLLYIERDFSQGLAIINNQLTEQPAFAEASLLQGYLYFVLTDYEKASDSFEQYLESYPLDHNIRFFLVNSLIKAGKFEQADALTDKLLAIFKKSPLALQYKAQIAFQANDFLKAREFASQAVAYDEVFIIAKMIAGVSSYKLDELEQAYDYLIGLEDMLPATHPINVILLSIKIKLGHTDDIASSVAKLNALKNSDSDSELLQISSVELMKSGDFASAQTLLNKAGQVSPSSAGIKVQRGALLLSQGDLSGVKSLEQALTIDPSLHETEFALARQYIQGDELSKAQVIATKWLASEEYQVSGNVLSGLIASSQEKVIEAEIYFNKALSLDKNNISALYSLAAVYEFKKQTEHAIEGYEKVIELNPNHHNAIRRYGVLQTKNENTVTAISFLSALHDQNKLNGKTHKNLVIGLAQNLRVNNQLPAAIKLLESLQNEKNLPSRYWIILANSYTSNQQNDYALATYKKAVKVTSNSYILRVGYISALEKLKKYGKALVIAKQANEDFPNDNNLMSTLAYLELANNNEKAAKKQLEMLKEKGISNFLIIATEAKIAMIEKDYEQAINLYGETYKKTPNGNNVINLARALQFSKQGDEAEKELESYLSKNANDNQVRMLLAELYGKNNISENNSAKIISTYRDMIKIQPDNIVALNNLAWKEYQINDLVNAQLHIEQALAIAPNEIFLQESYGVILVANKTYQQAIEILTAAVEKGSVEVNAKVALAEAYIATKQPEVAKDVLLGLSAHDSELNIKIAKLKKLVE
ncbi:XrtA/PEP-CTERM system TPR-repeat protein PrsT [Colwellia sp. 12G3]|uniref:XrtA/PEP-CTERM system TPR-repeat protein PrsT n=1 Tax=Colwellia sp. 12G3 TaxID=2058299 RepID=UPI000C342F75|nr:XrtA/PEP-CTERM system TPR-repeat protein PrsT [Colwellia sp. 12G3]PKI17787.1 PEP-CTERM system TPR-repeat protein PrsT [Colwellia sp. 12G3]